jgi:hypothetical protein
MATVRYGPMPLTSLLSVYLGSPQRVRVQSGTLLDHHIVVSAESSKVDCYSVVSEFLHLVAGQSLTTELASNYVGSTSSPLPLRHTLRSRGYVRHFFFSV